MAVCACPCGRILPDAAVKAGDVFATRACAAAHYGTEARSVTATPVSSRRSTHAYAAALTGPVVPFNVETRLRAEVDRRARVRVAAEKRHP